MQAESLEVLEKASVAPAQARAFVRAIEIELVKAPETLATKNWTYFPEPGVPFYRVTVFSNYSPHHVPDPGRQWSLLCEVSESPERPVDAGRVVDDVVAGLRAVRFLPPGAALASLWHRRLEHGYSLQFSAHGLWRRWTDGAELDDEDLGAELVGWTFRLATERAASSTVPR